MNGILAHPLVPFLFYDMNKRIKQTIILSAIWLAVFYMPDWMPRQLFETVGCWLGIAYAFFYGVKMGMLW
jgi:hypothetical protein